MCVCVKSPINFRYVLQAKWGEEVQKACKIVLNRRPLCIYFSPYIIMYARKNLVNRTFGLIEKKSLWFGTIASANSWVRIKYTICLYCK